MATETQPVHKLRTRWTVPEVAFISASVATREFGSAWSVANRRCCAAHHRRSDALCPAGAAEGLAPDDAARLALAQVAEVLAYVLSTRQHFAANQ